MNVTTTRCICPPLADGSVRHEAGDTITLRDKMPFRDVVAMRYEVGVAKEENDATPEHDEYGGVDMLALLTEGYLTRGVESWTLERDGAKGAEPIPVSRSSITQYLLSEVDVALEVADIADDLYAGVVILPLLKAASTSSPSTPTAASTSARTRSQTRRRKQSKRSSITTIPTAGTERTQSSPDGDSSSLPRSALAG
jgi:hypothetical protein